MIAKYSDGFFNVDLTSDLVNIWSYSPVEGFSRGVTRRGTIYYEKFVPISEIEEIFTIGFSVKWNGEWWDVGSVSSDGSIVSIGSTNRELSEKYGLTPNVVERGVVELWGRALRLNELSEFIMRKKSKTFNSCTETHISLDGFKKYYKEYVYNLSPWNFQKKF